MFDLPLPPTTGEKEPTPGKFELVVDANYFAKTRAIGRQANGSI